MTVRPQVRSTHVRALAILAATVLIGAFPAGATAAATGTVEAKRPFCPKGSAGERERFDASRLVGKTVPKARAMAGRHDCLLRVVRRDGVWLTVTADLLTNRINVAVRDGIVRRVVGIG